MRRMLVATLPFVIGLGPAVAGPPQKASGRMVLDEVADGLRKYRNETNPEKRMDRLEQLARTHDPRVAIVLGELLGCPGEQTQLDAACIILRYYHSVDFYGTALGLWISAARSWWNKNEADLKRRAKQLPQ